MTYIDKDLYAYGQYDIYHTDKLEFIDGITVCKGSFTSSDVNRIRQKNLYMYTPYGVNDYSYILLSKDVVFYRYTGKRENVPIDISYHEHFSSFVKYRDIIEQHHDMLYLQNDELYYRETNTTKETLLALVESLWMKHDERALAFLFFNVIKDVNFLPIYCRMIIDEMNKNSISELHLRLRIGSSGDMKRELDIIRNNTDGRVKIIAQYGKYAKDKITYFRAVKALNDDLIIGYDLVGPEYKFIPDIKLFNEINDKPWFLHIGEGKHLKRNMENIKPLNLKRIGHGIASFNRPDLQTYHMELAPIGYYISKLLTPSEIRRMIKDFRKNGTFFTISADDTNKYFDQDIQENYLFLKGIGVDV